MRVAEVRKRRLGVLGQYHVVAELLEPPASPFHLAGLVLDPEDALVWARRTLLTVASGLVSSG